MRRVLGLVFLLAFLFSAYSKNETYNFRNFNNENGLPHNFVYDIAQSPLGYLIVSTERGVYKYNGANFELYNEALTNDIVTSICRGENGLIYGTLNGTIHFVDSSTYSSYGRIDDLVNYKGTTYFIEGSREIKMSQGDSVSVESILDGGFITDLRIAKDEMFFLQNNQLCQLHPDLKKYNILDIENAYKHIAVFKNRLLACSATNAIVEKTESGFKKLYQLDSTLEITAIQLASTGEIWIGTKDRGVILLSPYKNEYEEIDYSNFFSSNPVNFLFEDDEDNIWVGTHGGGLLQFVPNVFPFKKTDYRVVDAVVLQDTALCVIGRNQVEQFPINENGILLNRTLMHELDASVFSVCVFEDKIYLGTNNGLYQIKDNNFEQKQLVFDGQIQQLLALRDHKLAVCVPHQGLLILDTSYTILKKYNLINGLPGNNIETLFEDSHGNIWLYVTNNGLVKINETIELFTRKNEFPNVRITDIKEDKNGKVWFVTEGRGIFVFDNEKDSFENIDIETGLLTNFPSSISFYNNEVWIFYREGVQKINRYDHIINYHAIDHAVSSFSKAALSSNRGVFALSHKGVKQVNYKLDSLEHSVRQPYFEKIFVNNRQVCDRDTVFRLNESLSHDQKNVLISFMSVFLKYNDQYYRYKLNGLENDWTYTSDEPKINYSNLKHGEYTFVVQNSKDKYFDNYKESTFDFEIDKPFWDEWWFYFMQIAILVGLAVLLYKLSKGSSNRKIVRFSSYIAIFLIFDFIHELAEPYFIESAQNITIIKISINLCIALLLYPLEILIQRSFRK